MPRATKNQSHDTSRKGYGFIVSVIGAGCVVIGLAVFLGTSDSGQIDVTSAIESSNQARQEAGEPVSEAVSTIPEAFRNKTNGGLVPQDAPAQAEEPQAEPEPVATSTSESESEVPESEEVTPSESEGVEETESVE